jgi:hypothetical protein
MSIRNEALAVAKSWRVDVKREGVYRGIRIVDLFAALISLISACLNYFEVLEDL